MRFTHLDILEQCFHEKFRGYSKQEVDTFLQLIADDFEEMAEEIEALKAQAGAKAPLTATPATADGTEKNPEPDPGLVKEIADLKNEIGRKDQLIQKLQQEQAKKSNGDNPLGGISPKVIGDKARRIILFAREKAEQQKQRATRDLTQLQDEIKKLKQEKKHLLQTLKTDAKNYLQSLSQKNNTTNSSNASGNKNR